MKKYHALFCERGDLFIRDSRTLKILVSPYIPHDAQTELDLQRVSAFCEFDSLDELYKQACSIMKPSQIGKYRSQLSSLVVGIDISGKETIEKRSFRGTK